MPDIWNKLRSRTLAAILGGASLCAHCVNSALAEGPRWFSRRDVARAASPDAADAGVVRLNSQSGSNSDIQQIGFTAPDFCPPNYYPAYQRMLPGNPHCPPCEVPVVVAGPGVMAVDPTQYPDEYLCDGGDRGYPFHYSGDVLGGLETEDTIGESYDITGERHVTPSSKVCIYAPRFGSVRSMTGTVVSQHQIRAAGAHEGVRVAGIETNLGIDEQVQRDRLQLMALRSRASQVEAEAHDIEAFHSTHAVGHQQQIAIYQNLAFISDGEFRQAEQPVLSYGALAAGVWTRDQFPVFVGQNARGAEVEVEFNAHEYVGAEDKRSGGELRIVKLADTDVARSGDVVTFTIRFDNLGQLELRQVRIVDNLTSRLQYVPGSADSRLPGNLDIAPNGEGSSVLTFTLDEPLPGLTGGTITFQCRVR